MSHKPHCLQGLGGGGAGIGGKAERLRRRNPKTRGARQQKGKERSHRDTAGTGEEKGHIYLTLCFAHASPRTLQGRG